jgi:hypothetical protein
VKKRPFEVGVARELIGAQNSQPMRLRPDAFLPASLSPAHPASPAPELPRFLTGSVEGNLGIGGLRGRSAKQNAGFVRKTRAHKSWPMIKSKNDLNVRKWWNWQTHHLEGVAPKGVGVQIPPSAPEIPLANCRSTLPRSTGLECRRGRSSRGIKEHLPSWFATPSLESLF